MKINLQHIEMKRSPIKLTAVLFVYFILFSSCSQRQNDESGYKLPLVTGNEYLDIFMADGDRMITRPQHLGIVNGMASVGISHDYVGVLDGLWAIPLVSSDFYLEPRLWGERIKTEHYTWLPFQTKRIGCLNGVEVKSTTTLIYGKRAGVLTLKLRNTSKKEQNIPLQFRANNPFTYRVSLDNQPYWGFGTAYSKTKVANVRDQKGILRVQGDHAVALGGDLAGLWWEEPTRRFHGKVSLKPGEEISTSLVFSIEEKGKAKQERDAILSAPETHITQSTEAYISEVENIYNKVPTFTSDNKALERIYNRSLSIFITNKFDVPEFVFNPYYGTGAVKGGCTKNYLYNFGQVPEILTLIDPESTRKHIMQFIRSGCLYNGHSFYPLTGKSGGSWYMVNQENLIRLIYYYVQITGDAGFLQELVLDDQSILDKLIENATHLDDISKPVKLINYGVDFQAANSHLELRREFKYNHVMPDINGRRYNNYKRVSELCEFAGDPQPHLMERAEALKELLKEELWNPGIQWFNFINAQGEKDLRYTIQMYKMFDSDVLDEEMEQGLLSHLNEEEFLSDYGLHSMSKKDEAYDQVDIDNGGGGICTSFTPLIVEFLYKDGKPQMADDILNRILWWGERMPYFPDSQPANEIDYRQDTPLQSNISTGCVAQCILFGMFGIDVAFDGTVTINPVQTELASELSLKGLKIRGMTMDIAVSGDTYEVISGEKTFRNKIGYPTKIEN